MKGSPSNRTCGLGGAIASMGVLLSRVCLILRRARSARLEGWGRPSWFETRPAGAPHHEADRWIGCVASQIILELHLAPVLRPGALEVGGVVARFRGRIDPHLADDPPGVVAFERTRRRVIGRAAGVRHGD